MDVSNVSRIIIEVFSDILPNWIVPKMRLFGTTLDNAWNNGVTSVSIDMTV